MTPCLPSRAEHRPPGHRPATTRRETAAHPRPALPAPAARPVPYRRVATAAGAAMMFRPGAAERWGRA